MYIVSLLLGMIACFLTATDALAFRGYGVHRGHPVHRGHKVNAVEKIDSVDTVNNTVNTNKIESFIQTKLPNASVGVVLQDANTGEILYARRSNEPFPPASLTKLLTAAASLIELGRDYRFETAIQMEHENFKEGRLDGDLYVKFSGDPSLTTGDLKQLVAAVKAQGVREISGDIVIDDTRFQEPHYALGWSRDALAWYYAAPITSVILNENKIELTVKSNKTLGEKASVSLMPEEPAKINLVADLQSVSALEAERDCQIQIDMDPANAVQVRGCWPYQSTASKLKIALKNPRLLARQTILEALKANKIEYKGTIKLASAPENVKNIAALRSLSLFELLKPILQDSNNIYAESMAKTLGVEKFNRGTFQAGVRAIKESLTKATGKDFLSLRLMDGSGLSNYNLVTPNHFARLLYALYHNKKVGEDFRDALARSNETGTLKDRAGSQALQGNMQAKTGSLSGVSTLAGYLRTHNKQDLIFVIMIDHVLEDKTKIKRIEDDLCQLFMGLL